MWKKSNYILQAVSLFVFALVFGIILITQILPSKEDLGFKIGVSLIFIPFVAIGFYSAIKMYIKSNLITAHGKKLFKVFSQKEEQYIEKMKDWELVVLYEYLVRKKLSRKEVVEELNKRDLAEIPEDSRCHSIIDEITSASYVGDIHVSRKFIIIDSVGVFENPTLHRREDLKFEITPSGEIIILNLKSNMGNDIVIKVKNRAAWETVKEMP